MTKPISNDSFPVLNATERGGGGGGGRGRGGDRGRGRARVALSAVVLTWVLSGCSSLGAWWPTGAAVGAGGSGGSAPAAAGARASAEGGGTDIALPWGTPAAALRAPPNLLPAAATARVEDPAYRIGPEDGLEISVWKDETLKSTTLVRPDGGISFPLVGDLPVAGKTASEVREEIARRLSRFVPEAEVTVSVVRVASYRVYVIGRVNRPGDFAVGRPLDVLQALTLAGGLTPFAVEDEIRIIRREAGRQVSIPFNYARLRKQGDLSQNITLRSGDVLLVP